MSEADDLFAEAYRLSVVDEEHEKAITICRQALKLDPNNHRVRVYLGMLLSDYGTTEQQEESREHFINAITAAKGNAELCDNWFEESSVHHLAIWKWNHEDRLAACLLFLADVLICHSKESQQYLFKLLDEVNPVTSAEIKSIIGCIAPEEPGVRAGSCDGRD